MRRRFLAIATSVAVAAALLDVCPARADATSWLSVGGGGAVERNRLSDKRDGAPVLTYAVGVASSPLAAFVLGGIFRGRTMFGLGTDAGAAVRFATGGFARGDWGVALDGGALWRPWRGGAYGEWPLQAVLTGGSPWGLGLAAGAELGSVIGGTSAEGFFVALEIDLLRLTLMRQGSSERWWPNPNPAGGRRAAALAP